MDKYLQFVASTNLKSLLGRGLVTDQIAAIFELVKNSYDADAEEVYISFEGLDSDEPRLIIQDNGTGMSLVDIERKWMVIGTDSKKSKQYSPIFNRALNGDKGIGRFAVDRLGNRLNLVSVARDSATKISMSFNWNEFEEKYQSVSDVKIPYVMSRCDKQETGLYLEIIGLRDEWNLAKLKELIRNLRQFKSPFAMDDNFKIIIDAPELGYCNYIISSENLEGISSLWIDVECKKENTDLVYMTVCKDGIEYEEKAVNKYNIGPMRMRVYFFNQGDKVRFKNRFAIRVRDFGNIRLYRDEFRIHPYGENNNDWLDIDRRMAQGYSRFFGSRDLVGYVQTYKRYNPGLIPLTNRQGLIENDGFQKLRRFVFEYAIKPLERYYFVKFKKNVNETLEKSKRQINTTTQQIDDIAKEISKYDKDLGKKLRGYVRDIKKQHSQQVKFAEEQQELTKVYSRIAQKETFLHQLIHQSLLDMRNAVAAVDRLEKTHGFCVEGQAIELFKLLKKSISDSMTKLLTVRDDLVRTRHKTKVDLAENIAGILNDYKGQFEEYSIQLEMNMEAKVEYLIDVGDLKAIINNLISNSIKALREVEDRARKILVELKKADRFIIIKIQDNGCGIDETNREKIFDPFFSTTQKYGGFGIGLTIVDEILKEYGGALELVEMETEGACFFAKLRR